MTNEEAKKEIKKVFEPAFANYIIKALIDGATESDVEPQEHTDEKYDELMKQYKHLRKYASDLETKLSVEQTEWISVKEAYTKGEWLFEPTQNNNNPWKCSCCGHRAGRYKYKTYKFCPWCGAKMDKGE